MTISKLAFLALLFFTGNLLDFQTDTTGTHKGKPIIQVFGNFDYNATQGTQKYGFWLGRAHFGYDYQFNNHFSGKIIIDAGRPTTVGQIEVTDTTGLNLNTSNTSKEGVIIQ